MINRKSFQEKEKLISFKILFKEEKSDFSSMKNKNEKSLDF